MNTIAKTLVFRVGLIALLVAVLTLLNRFRANPQSSAGPAWEQNPTNRPDWQQVPRR